ncbi:phenol hydroxylase subunit P4 [Oceanobacter mangrovi]|uniref:phenol hydroxylase subunit P4 n=1 Tax=Oceanobacter mangrovi TaxID=2862510 RepID=UPI001C8EF5F7|nr:phenol hydroxylase subunit P4 [Oceanobacter mangrovi]
MTVKTTAAEYIGEVRDRVENFHGNQLVYVGWDRHLMFCSAFTFLVAPAASFRSLRDDVMAGVFGEHPEWPTINWDSVRWLLDGQPFTPELDKTLADQGIGHKSLLRFDTPELHGFMNAGV